MLHSIVYCVNVYLTYRFRQSCNLHDLNSRTKSFQLTTIALSAVNYEVDQMRMIPVVACFLTVAVASEVRAQYYSVYGNGSYHHASTAAEGFQRGMADVVRSAGAANLMNSEAANNYEDARSKDLDNRLKGTNTYFEMRAANKAYREAEAGPRPTAEDIARYAHASAPKRLDRYELDPVSGQILWPGILRDPLFQEPRTALDTIFAARAANGYVGLSDAGQISTICDSMTQILKAQIKTIPPQIYMSARTFITRVAYEATLPVAS